MQHKMKLYDKPFELIKSGAKTIELRLYDEKRQKIKVGDIIHFIKTTDNEEILKTKVVNIVRAQSFEELFKKIDFEETGGSSQDDWKSMREIYSQEQEKRYGVLGIYLKVL